MRSTWAENCGNPLALGRQAAPPSLVLKTAVLLVPAIPAYMTFGLAGSTAKQFTLLAGSPLDMLVQLAPPSVVRNTAGPPVLAATIDRTSPGATANAVTFVELLQVVPSVVAVPSAVQ